MISNLPGFKDEVEILKSLFGDSYEQAGGQGHRFFHSIRVARNCLELQEKLLEKISHKNILVVAALFHDIGKVSRVESEGYLDGSQEADVLKGKHDSFQTVLPLLRQYIGEKYSIKELELMSNYISGNDSKESQLLQDADNLDEVGLVNVWKMFTYGGLNKVSIEDTIEYYLEEDRDRLIKKIKGRMNFPETEKISMERLHKVDVFIKNLVDEIEAKDLQKFLKINKK